MYPQFSIISYRFQLSLLSIGVIFLNKHFFFGTQYCNQNFSSSTYQFQLTLLSFDIMSITSLCFRYSKKYPQPFFIYLTFSFKVTKCCHNIAIWFSFFDTLWGTHNCFSSSYKLYSHLSSYCFESNFLRFGVSCLNEIWFFATIKHPKLSEIQLSISIKVSVLVILWNVFLIVCQLAVVSCNFPVIANWVLTK